MRKPNAKAFQTAFGNTTSSSDRATPESLKAALYEKYGLTHDPCPLGGYELMLEDKIPDGLTTPWHARNFVNPPFKETVKWVRKAIDELDEGRFSVLLIPARTNTKYWHSLIATRASEIYFITKSPGFVFSGYPRACPFPIAIVVFDPNAEPIMTKVNIGGFDSFSNF